jgi:ribosomal protein L40E
MNKNKILKEFIDVNIENSVEKLFESADEWTVCSQCGARNRVEDGKCWKCGHKLSGGLNKNNEYDYGDEMKDKSENKLNESKEEEFASIKHGDKVYYKNPQGQTRSGRAVMYNKKVDAWVLNIGGQHGTPALVDLENFVSKNKLSENKLWGRGKDYDKVMKMADVLLDKLQQKANKRFYENFGQKEVDEFMDKVEMKKYDLDYGDIADINSYLRDKAGVITPNRADENLKQINETGEPDQDYDHKTFDEICNALKKKRITAIHREFDKYQGIYITTPLGKLWTVDFFNRGKWGEGILSSKLIDWDGNDWSGNSGDYWQYPKDKVFDDQQLVITKIENGKFKKITKNNPKVSDLPDTVLSSSKFTPGKDILVFWKEGKPEEETVEYEVGSKNVDDLVNYLKSDKENLDEENTIKGMSAPNQMDEEMSLVAKEIKKYNSVQRDLLEKCMERVKKMVSLGKYNDDDTFEHLQWYYPEFTREEYDKNKKKYHDFAMLIYAKEGAEKYPEFWGDDEGANLDLEETLNEHIDKKIEEFLNEGYGKFGVGAGNTVTLSTTLRNITVSIKNMSGEPILSKTFNANDYSMSKGNMASAIKTYIKDNSVATEETLKRILKWIEKSDVLNKEKEY